MMLCLDQQFHYRAYKLFVKPLSYAPFRPTPRRLRPEGHRALKSTPARPTDVICPSRPKENPLEYLGEQDYPDDDAN
jgi:hypothetical protein